MPQDVLSDVPSSDDVWQDCRPIGLRHLPLQGRRRGGLSVFLILLTSAYFMTSLQRIAVSAGLAAVFLALPGVSSASFSLLAVSDSIATTVGSISKSSENSSNAVAKVAEGDYKVIAVAQADAAHPGRTQLTLAAAGNERNPVFNLYVPQEDMRQGNVRVGDVVHAQKRAYGLAFARQGEAKPFTLVLDDRWNGEFRPRLVS